MSKSFIYPLQVATAHKNGQQVLRRVNTANEEYHAVTFHEVQLRQMQFIHCQASQHPRTGSSCRSTALLMSILDTRADYIGAKQTEPSTQFKF